MGKYVVPECEYCYLKNIEIAKHFDEKGKSCVTVVCTYDLQDKNKKPLPHIPTATKVTKMLEKDTPITDTDIVENWSDIMTKVDSITAAAKLEYAGYDIKAG